MQVTHGASGLPGQAAHEAYEALAENAGTHRCMLLKIAEEECRHAQMILCILQTCL